MTTTGNNDTKHQLLKLLADPAYAAFSQNDLAEVLGIKQPALSQHLSELRESDYIDVDTSRAGNDIKHLTREGYRTLHGGNEPIWDSESGPISIHKRWIAFKHDTPVEETDWVGKWAQNQELEHRYLGNDQWAVFAENFKYRITSQHVFVMLGEVRGHDPHHLMNCTMADAFDAVNWLDEHSPDSVRITTRPAELEINLNQQHVSFIAHPLAQLIANSSELELSDVKVYDKSGNERLKFDESHGPELESELPDFGEEDIQHEVDRLQHQLEHPERHKWIYEDMPEEFSEVKETQEDLLQRVKELEEQQPVEQEVKVGVSQSFEVDGSRSEYDRNGYVREQNYTNQKVQKIADKMARALGVLDCYF